MAEEEDKKEEKFDFTREGEALGYISLAQAQILAMRTASEAPGAYGHNFSGVSMAFDIAESREDEDYYNITLSFRPEGQFTGTPGQEQFFIEKEGSVAHRQVLSIPRRRRRVPIVPVGIGLAAVVAVAVGAVFATGGVGEKGWIPQCRTSGV